MKIKEFENKLKEIDPKFEIVQHPNNPELAGLYHDRNDANKSGFVVTVPANEIREEFDANFTDSTGHPHNWASKVTFIANEHLRRLAEDADYKENFYAPIDFSQSPRA